MEIRASVFPSTINRRTAAYRLAALTVAPWALAAAPTTAAATLDGKTIRHAAAAAQRFLLAAQLPGGNFHGEWQSPDGFAETHEPQVQAQCLWTLAGAYHAEPRQNLREAIRRGIQFFVVNSKELSSSRLVVTHPFSRFADTATIAFVALAIEQLVRTPEAIGKTERTTYLVTLQQYANFLLTMQTASGRYHSRYHQQSGLPVPGPDARTDGIVLLALTRTAALLKSPELTQHLNRAFKSVLTATVNAKPGPDFDAEAPHRFSEFGLQALAEFATNTNNASWQKECVRIAALMAAALPDPAHRFTRIMHLSGLAAAWPLMEQYGNKSTTTSYAFRLQEEVGILIRHQIAGPDPLPALPVWSAAAGALAEDPKAETISVQPSAEFLATVLTIQAAFFSTR